MNLRKLLVLLILLSTSFLFAQHDKKVFNLENTKDTIYLNKTGTVDGYSNCRSEDDDSIKFEKFIQALQPINSQLISFIGQEKFNFQTKESKISIMHKYYVNSKGEIEYCSFMAHSKLSKRTEKRYTRLLEEFIKDRKVNYESETPFFICGQSILRLKDGQL